MVPCVCLISFLFTLSDRSTEPQYIIACLLGSIIGGIIAYFVNKWNEDKKREELKNQIRMKLNSEVYPQVVDEVGNKIESALMTQLEVVNTSIEKSNHILALSTCTEPVSSNRLIVFAYIYE